MERLTDTKTLWRLFAVFAVLSIGMLSWILYHDLRIIDEISDPGHVKAVLDLQSPEQHQAHFLMTLIGDLPYPFAYGLLFAGLTLKFLGRWGKWLCIPALIAIPADTIENISQLFILKGNMDFLTVKAIVTPIKLASFMAALFIALIALCVALKRRLSSNAS